MSSDKIDQKVSCRLNLMQECNILTSNKTVREDSVSGGANTLRSVSCQVRDNGAN